MFSAKKMMKSVIHRPLHSPKREPEDKGDFFDRQAGKVEEKVKKKVEDFVSGILR